ncbi:MAG: GTPase Era [Candidatus Schekmanbacteria bacterium]|nr:MAG: GTPase Era [Candidatus Schekmanbacteria bacterium]
MAENNFEGEGREFRCGFIALVGRPNTGKSTLLNRILDTKIAITSAKPQTTRNRITGILNGEDYQAIFLDTPGINVKKGLMRSHLVKIALSTLNYADIVLFIIDAKAGIKKDDIVILDKIEKVDAMKILLINKIDLLKKEELLPLIDSLKKYEFIEEFIPISAKRGTNLKRLISVVVDNLPIAPRYFEADIITDRPEEFLFAEYIREKIYRLLQEELPYCVHVEVEEIKERKEGLIYVSANIFVEKESQKGIIIGKKGEMIKEIGSRARKDIEYFTGCKVYLDLRVYVKKKWTENEKLLHKYGYTSDEN